MRCTLMSFRQTDEGQRDHHILQGVGARTLLVAPGLTTRNKKLLVSKGIATRSQDATTFIIQKENEWF